MIPMINLNNHVERELFLEKKGFRRTRRWIGDHPQAEENGWYQSKLSAVSEPEVYKEVFQLAPKNEPCLEVQESPLNRLKGFLGIQQRHAGRGAQRSAADC